MTTANIMASYFYGTKQWRQVRKLKLSMNPLCEDCETLGLIEPANHVDHIKAINNDGPKYDLDNLRSLCVRCHSRKTVYKDGGFGRQEKDYEIRAKGCSTNGTPIDPNHPWNR